ncbi:tryptophan 7-halogenase [Neiella marina]|uniref:Tryptophan 7-halogenase n=1 Tax=Neiella holothuriorum TaxID=2870530 RepID=A0ABS7EIC8_9GAMM|nr:tryptophan halogenase family protein [Neiella holothuriorum]MBW8192111.1 tryptophan 7-halogenase [Neiella holothuriorum]
MEQQISDSRVQKVVIVGGGTAGWMTAASLSKHYQHLDITLIESSDIGTVGVGEATIPSIRRFYRALGLTDQDVIKATQGTCKLGIEFKNWHSTNDTFFHPFGLYGQNVQGVSFHHYWLKMKKLGMAADFADYSLGCTLAMNDKFTTPSTKPPSELSIFDWALHFDASLFAIMMRQYAEKNGVTRVDAKIEQVELKPDNGFIDAVALDNGNRVGGDLFIDCSGFKGLLIEQALGAGYEDWSQWLLCDRAVAMQSELVTDAKPRTVSTAHESGWQWTIPLRHRQGNGLVYASPFISDDEAIQVLKNNIDGPLITEPNQFKFVPGRRKQAWVKNCVSIGLASGFLEPLESTSIAMIETGIEKLRMLFPDKSMNQACIDEFNDMTKLEWERVRDFIVLHYHLSGRTDSEFWRHIKTAEIPETLQHKINMFKVRGHLVKYRWEIFQPVSWLALYNGNKIYPEHYDPMVDNFPTEYLNESFKGMRDALQNAMAKTPSHSEFLQQFAV